MRCPSCKGRTHVLETRLHTAGTEIYRRRECKGCKARVATREFVVNEISLWAQHSSTDGVTPKRR